MKNSFLLILLLIPISSHCANDTQVPDLAYVPQIQIDGLNTEGGLFAYAQGNRAQKIAITIGLINDRFKEASDIPDMKEQQKERCKMYKMIKDTFKGFGEEGRVYHDTISQQLLTYFENNRHKFASPKQQSTELANVKKARR